MNTTPKKVRPMTVARLRSFKPKTRAKFFSRDATPEQIEQLTVECTGEAHSNAYIDSCGSCAWTTWGRMLRACDHPDCDPRQCAEDGGDVIEVQSPDIDIKVSV